MYRGGIITKTPEQIDADGRGRRDPGALPADARRRRSAPASPPRARRGRREVHPLAGRRPLLQGLPRLPRARSAPRPTRWSSTASPAPTSCSAATSSRSTSASPTRAGSPTPRSPSRSARSAPRPTSCSRRPGSRCSTGSPRPRPGNRLGDISHAVQGRVEADGLSIIRSLVGHGIGREMHEDPQIPNFGEPGKGPELEEGMVLAIEPMVNAGGPEVRMGDDDWAVYSAGRLARRPLRVHGRRHRGRPARSSLPGTRSSS